MDVTTRDFLVASHHMELSERMGVESSMLKHDWNIKIEMENNSEFIPEPGHCTKGSSPLFK